MQQIPIQNLPNQSLTVVLDDNTWQITLKTVQEITVASIQLNGEDVEDSIPCAAGAFLIPSIYQESGNFFFVTQNQQIPFYTLFNVSQSLIYLSPDELAAYRAPKTPPVTAEDFNPIAALPLRFAPQGYTEA